MSKNKRRIIIGVIVCLILAVSLFWGNDIPQNSENVINSNTVKTQQQEEQSDEHINTQNEASQSADEKAKAPKQVRSEPEKSVLLKTQDDSGTSERMECTLSVTCFSVLENFEKLKENKREIIPRNGVILKERTVEFFPDESVFDVLNREMKNNNIHFEYVLTPAYNSAYIKGIANLYEFDCGELSGWMYKVNGIKLTYGSSQCKLKNNDKIEVYYSCDMFK